MGKGKGKGKRDLEVIAPGVEPTPKVKPLRVPLFEASWAREHLLEHHGITTTAEQPAQLLAAIHQADHVAAGVGGRPIVVPHYHTADVKRKDSDE